MVWDAFRVLSRIGEEIPVNSEEVNMPPVEVSGRAGRPRFVIPVEQLQYLVDNKFTVPQMADMIGVSERTIHRRLSSNNIYIRSNYSDISDRELDEIVGHIHSQFPLCGNKQMIGHLTSLGFRVQQIRVRESMRRVDPEGTIARRLSTINRRVYSVPSPLSLWHIDGNHKLIRLAAIHDFVLFIMIFLLLGGDL